MRVVGGSARGTVIKTLRGSDVRPTSDKVREALFDILFTSVQDSSFLDCYAGSGAIGIEALSRGAKEAIFIEENKRSVAVIKENLMKSKFLDRATIINMSFESALRELGKNRGSFDLIFADPPYLRADYTMILEEILDHGLLGRKGILIIEHLKREQLPDDIDRIKRFKMKIYGQAALSFYKFL